MLVSNLGGGVANGLQGFSINPLKALPKALRQVAKANGYFVKAMHSKMPATIIRAGPPNH